MDLAVLLQQPESRRDEAWEKAFLEDIVKTKVVVTKDQATTGPDGWPYLDLKTSAAADQPFLAVLEWAAQRGIGLVLNTHKMVPDYVFPYGMLWNYALNRQFITTGTTAKPGNVVIAETEEMIVGAPSEEYLPGFVRQVLREFLQAQGFETPRVTVLSTKDYRVVDLLFAAESLGNLQPKDFRTMSEALSWFLPLHYNIVIGSEQNLRGFVPL